jgi:hypothetical protein
MDEIYPKNESKRVRCPKAEFYPGDGNIEPRNIEQRNRPVKRLNRIGYHVRSGAYPTSSNPERPYLRNWRL